LNRSAVEEIEFDHSHIAGGLSKINTADNVFGIFTSRAMRERGRYQLQLMKTRSSSGVGQKIDLEFDINSLRIRDCEGGGEEPAVPSSTIMNQIKAKSQVNKTADAADVENGEVTSVIQKDRISDMLNKLRTPR